MLSRAALQDWFNYYTHARLTRYNASASTGANFSFCSALDDTAHLPLLQRGGTAVFTQLPRLTTAETAKQPFTLLLAVDSMGRSTGRLSLDDGLTLGNIAAGQYNAFTVDAHFGAGGGSSLVGSIRYSAQRLAPQYDVSSLRIQRIVVMGLDVGEKHTVTAPRLTLLGEQAALPLHASTLRSNNGALLIEVALPVGRDWQLDWSSDESSTGRRGKTAHAATAVLE